jgi:hypothetical protein
LNLYTSSQSILDFGDAVGMQHQLSYSGFGRAGGNVGSVTKFRSGFPGSAEFRLNFNRNTEHGDVPLICLPIDVVAVARCQRQAKQFAAVRARAKAV